MNYLKQPSIAFLLLISSFNADAQWAGSTTTSDRVYRNGPLTVGYGNSSRVSLGEAVGGSPIWGKGYIGFNLTRESSGLWSYLHDGATNGGMVMYNSGNNLMISLKTSTGASSGTITDAQVVDNNVIRFNGDKTVDVLNGDFRVRPGTPFQAALGAAWGSGGIEGQGYLGFNISRDNAGTGNWPYTHDGAKNGGSVIYGHMNGDIVFSMKGNTGASSGILTDAGIVQNSKVRFTNDGKVVIADQTVELWGASPVSIDYSSNNYKLFVEKGILTERVRVAIKNSTEWADYVFDKDYELMPLKELEQYIHTEKHLPDVPTTEQVMKEGVDLGEMQARLLQKVEELTRYVIMQQQEIDELKRKQKNNSK